MEKKRMIRYKIDSRIKWMSCCRNCANIDRLLIEKGIYTDLTDWPEVKPVELKWLLNIK